MRAACRVKGLLEVVGKSSKHIHDCFTVTNSVTSTRKKEKSSGIIISALGDAPLRVVIEAEDHPGKWNFLMRDMHPIKRFLV